MLQRVYTRVSKPAARYSDRGSMAEHCSACRFFMSGGDCARVLGRVLPQGWCKYFSREAVQRWNPLWPMEGIPLPPGVSLDLSFLTPGSLDPRITFARASGGTYFDRNGVMQNAAVNLQYPSVLSAGPWAVNGPAAIGGSVIAPDGTIATAALISATDTTNAVRNVTPSGSGSNVPTGAPTTAYTISAYMKTGPVSNGYIQVLALPGATAAAVAYFDLTNGVAVVGADLVAGCTAKSASITPAANGWYRVTFGFTAPAGTTGLQAYIGPCTTVSGTGDNRSFAGVVGQGTYLWGVQLELGSTASPYIPTTSAPGGAPRWDYNPATLALNGLLIEEARTNTALSSGNLGAAPWAPAATGATPVVTANNATAPDGTLTAARIVMPAVPAGANAAFVAQATGIPSAQQTSSMWLRGAVGGETVNLAFTNFITYFHTTAVLTTAWQRFSVVGTSVAGGWDFFVGTDMRDPTQTPTVAQTFYAWGAQVEVGAFPTSYIPTTAAAVTRAADACSVPVAAWYNTTQGSMELEYIFEGTNPSYGAAISLVGANVSTDFIYTDQLDGTGMPGQISAGGGVTAASVSLSATIYSANIPLPVGPVQKCAASWAVTTGIMGAHNGQLTLAPGAAPGSLPVIASLQIGQQVHYQQQFNLWARHARYWPRVLSNTEMQQVTT